MHPLPVATPLETSQLIPEGAETTFPFPAPAPNIVKVCVKRLNSAVTTRSWSMATGQAPDPLQPPPLHPTNSVPLAATAERVTELPLSRSVLHPVVLTTPDAIVQVIAGGCDVTLPSPVPAAFTVSRCALDSAGPALSQPKHTMPIVANCTAKTSTFLPIIAPGRNSVCLDGTAPRLCCCLDARAA
jgi:hypothetical protein